MVKSFLRYVQDSVFGTISTANVVYDKLYKRAVVCTLENITEFVLTEPDLEKKPAAVRVALNPDGRSLAAGYTDGTIRLWSFPDRSVTVTLSGHRTEITALRYNKDGSLLASGSKENEIVVWDVAQERGLYRLRGHTNAVTDVCFLSTGNKIASSSKDGFVKIWDCITQHCIQTLTGHRGPVSGVAEVRGHLVTGGTDCRLRVWSIIDGTKEENDITANAAESTKGGEKRAPEVDADELKENEDDDRCARFVGEIILPATQSIRGIECDREGVTLAAIAGDKTVLCYKVNSEEEILKKRRRRQRRLREKQQKKAKGETDSTQTEEKTADNEESKEQNEENPALDLLVPLHTIRPSAKIRGVDLCTSGNRVVVSLSDNSIEEYKSAAEDAIERTVRIERQGHRAGVRAAVLSEHCDSLATVDSSELKVWRISARGGSCATTQKADYGLCVAFCPGEKHVVVGTKSGRLEVHGLASGEMWSAAAHHGAVWGLSAHPTEPTLATCGADKTVKLWNYELQSDTENPANKHLGLTQIGEVNLEDEALAVAYSPKGTFLAVALLDTTIKIYKTDGMKFYLSLYGHKLPVLSLSFSDDERLLVSGSADKNIKIWGLDFGDCHRSLFAHDESVSQVLFQKETHYVFSAGKDGEIKQWDADKFECIQCLRGHRGAVLALCGSREGTVLASAGMDTSIRIWKRTDEQIFLDEERDKALETTFEKTLIEQEEFTERNDPNLKESELGSKKTLDTLKTAESLIETLELAVNERTKMRAYDDMVAASATPVAPYERNVLLQGQTPSNFLLKKLVSLPPSHLDQAMLLLPFTMLPQFLEFAIDWIKKGKRIELVSDCVFFLLRINQGRLSSSTYLHNLVLEAKKVITQKVKEKKDMIGFNVAGLSFLKQRMELDTKVAFYSFAEEKLKEISEKNEQ